MPHNVVSLERLGRMYLIDQAVVDLIGYHDPRTPTPMAEALAAQAAEASAGFEGSAEETRAVPGPLHPCAVPDNCEALVVACGAHLHWHLATCGGARYREERVGGQHAGDHGGGLPPEYGQFVRQVCYSLLG